MTRSKRPDSATSPPGFTLVELLVVIGIIALLISILLPTLGAARQAANVTKCQSNIRQIVTALILYQNEHKGKLPPNLGPGNGPPAVPPGVNITYEQVWFHGDRIGRYLPKTFITPSGNVATPVMACPTYVGMLPGLKRSYAMNTWASSAVSVASINQGNLVDGTNGSLWGVKKPRDSSSMILVTEAWAFNRIGSDFFANATVPNPGLKPGQAFGVNGGYTGVFGSGYQTGIGFLADCELPYLLHRGPKVQAKPQAIIGRVNVGYLDGHVAIKEATELADATARRSRFDSLWSPRDRSIKEP